MMNENEHETETAQEAFARVEGELALLRRHDGLGVGNLRAQASLADGGRGHVAGQRQARGLQLETLVVHRRAQAFKLAALAAEQVERVGNFHAGAVQREWPGTGNGGDAERVEVDLLARGVELGVHPRQQARAGGGHQFLARLFDAGLCLRQRRAGIQRRADGAVQRGAAEQRPPLRRHVGAALQRLRLAVGRVGGAGARWLRALGIGRRSGRGRLGEVRTHRACGKHGCRQYGEDRAGCGFTVWRGLHGRLLNPACGDKNAPRWS